MFTLPANWLIDQPYASYQEVHMTFAAALIEARNLIKRYGDKAAVNNVSFRVNEGEIFGFLGPNGAGKTTTIKMIVGLLQPTSGAVTVCGYDVQTQPVQAKASNGYVPDTPNLYPKLSGRELLRFVGDLYQMDRKQIEYRIKELLNLFDLSQAGDDTIDSYSHGMQQKTALAAALMHDPKVLVLDEPTVGLDPRSARMIKDILRQMADRGAAIFLSTHILEIAERMCDRIGIINRGQLVAVGTMAELRAIGNGNAPSSGTTTGSETSLEDIFLSLTGGADYAEITEVLG
jgi:ABC-2 type transport system ATP-binding protein